MKQNIRLHALKSIREGMPAIITVVDQQPGLHFPYDDEFIPFCDLGYHPNYGYYRLSVLPGVMSECDSTNPEQIHSMEQRPDGEQMFAWVDSDGDPHMLGEIWQLADLYQAIGAALAGQLTPGAISETDDAWGRNFTIARAVQEALETGYGNEAHQMANTIRTAAREGRIRGATQDPTGRWSLPKRQFRHWLVRSKDERRGRPAKAAEPQPIITIEIPDHTGPVLNIAGGITLTRQSFQAGVPDARLYVDIWQGTDPKTGQMYQGWLWMLYYD
jgi:hypothetical protein